MKTTNFLARLICAAGFLAAAGGAGAQSLTIVAGTSCSGANSATFTPGGGAVTISVCATAPVSTCGATIQLESAAGESNLFQVASRTRGASFDTDNAVTVATGANTITNPANTQDLGATNGTAVAAATGVVVATFTVTPPAVAPNNSYVITAGGLSSLTSTSTTCGVATEVASTPSFTFNKAATPSTAVFTISTPVNVTEAGAAANATVTCTGAFASNQTLPVSLAFTTSNASGNFTTSASPLSFAACGGATQTITVTPRVDDATVQGPVVGGIALTAPAAGVATLGTQSSAVVNVADNDTPATVTIAVAPASATEAGGVLTYTITRTGGNQTVALPVSITPPAASGRYSTTCVSPVNIAANQATATCTVTGIDNAATDGNVNAAVTVTAGANYTVGSPATATGTITDDDGPPSVSVAVSGSPATEEGGVLTFTFTRTGNAGQIAAALNGIAITPPAVSSRYTTTCASPINFAAASATATCTVTGVGNTAVDGNVNAVVTVNAGSGYTVGSPASATGVITDNEVGVSVAAAAGSITEGGLATFNLTCSGTAAGVTVNYTVNSIAGDVVTPANSTTINCPAGGSVTVQTQDNTNPADSRSLVLTITSVSGGGAVIGSAPSTAIAVNDNDGPPPAIPTMGTFGLALFGLLMAGIGGLVQRRRK